MTASRSLSSPLVALVDELGGVDHGRDADGVDRHIGSVGWQVGRFELRHRRATRRDLLRDVPVLGDGRNRLITRWSRARVMAT